MGRLGPHHLFGLQVLQRFPRQGPRRSDPLDRPRELDQVRGQVRPVPLPEPPLVAAREGDARVPDRSRRVADDRQGPGLPQLRGVGPREVRRGRRQALHEPLQLQGLGDAVEGDGLLLDRRARLGRRLAQGDRDDGRAEDDRLGSQREVRLSAPRRHARTLERRSLPLLGDDRVRYHKRAVAVDEEKREIAFSDGTTRSYDRLLTTMPLDGLRRAADARSAEGPRGGAVAPLQPPVLGRRRPAAPLARRTRTGSTSRTRRRRSTG